MIRSESSRVVWCKLSPSTGVNTHEAVIAGAVSEAISHACELANETDFVIGQVLSVDGRVLANIAPGGLTRLS